MVAKDHERVKEFLRCNYLIWPVRTPVQSSGVQQQPKDDLCKELKAMTVLSSYKRMYLHIEIEQGSGQKEDRKADSHEVRELPVQTGAVKEEMQDAE